MKPITTNNEDGVPRIVALGRVSTPEQQASNINAGQDWALSRVMPHCPPNTEVIRLGEQGSGMVRDRKMTIELYRLIESGRIDAVVTEDVSRAYRNPRFILAIVQDCVDAEIRFISIGDRIDTAEEDWEIALNNAASRHGTYIPDVRRRIRRTALDSWLRGGMVIKVPGGYKKLTKEEAATGNYGTPGLRMTRLHAYIAFYRKAFEMLVVEHRRLRDVLRWAVENNVPPPSYAAAWTLRLLRQTLRKRVLFGLRRHRVISYEYKYSTGEHVRKPNEANCDQKLWPELAFYTKEEWDQVQTALDEQGHPPETPSGKDNRRFKLPFVCAGSVRLSIDTPAAS